MQICYILEFGNSFGNCKLIDCYISLWSDHLWGISECQKWW